MPGQMPERLPKERSEDTSENDTTVDPKQWMDSRSALRNRVKPLRTANNTRFGEKCKMRPPPTKGNMKRDKLGDKTGDGGKLGQDNGRQEETRSRKGGHAIQHEGEHLKKEALTVLVNITTTICKKS